MENNFCKMTWQKDPSFYKSYFPSQVSFQAATELQATTF